MSFQFDREKHEYTLNGKRLPSVTEVLGMLTDFSAIAPAVLEAARDRGERVHAAINAHNRGAFDYGEDDQIARYVEQWQRYLDESKAVVIASEQPMYHAALKFAGTPDCVLQIGRRVVVPDVKATFAVPPTVGPQCAAYAALYGDRYRRVVERVCVHIGPDGYTLHKRDDPADWSVFVSCLNIHKWLEKNR